VIRRLAKPPVAMRADRHGKAYGDVRLPMPNYPTRGGKKLLVRLFQVVVWFSDDKG